MEGPKDSVYCSDLPSHLSSSSYTNAKVTFLDIFGLISFLPKAFWWLPITYRIKSLIYEALHNQSCSLPDLLHMLQHHQLLVVLCSSQAIPPCPYSWCFLCLECPSHILSLTNSFSPGGLVHMFSFLPLLFFLLAWALCSNTPIIPASLLPFLLDSEFLARMDCFLCWASLPPKFMPTQKVWMWPYLEIGSLEDAIS